MYIYIYIYRDLDARISSKFKVTGIPTLLFLDAVTGNVLEWNGRERITQDHTGANLPWASTVRHRERASAEASARTSEKGGGEEKDVVYRAPAVTGVDIPEDLSKLSLKELKRLLQQCKMSQVVTRVCVCVCVCVCRQGDRDAEKKRRRFTGDLALCMDWGLIHQNMFSPYTCMIAMCFLCT